MNFETLSFDNQATFTTNEVATSSSELPTEVTPMSTDSYHLVGGGSAIFLFD